MDRLHCVHRLVDVYFQFGVIMKNAAVDIHIQVFMQTRFLYT
jgi:hypothetical protein